jgi:hypothetical protein
MFASPYTEPRCRVHDSFVDFDDVGSRAHRRSVRIVGILALLSLALLIIAIVLIALRHLVIGWALVGLYIVIRFADRLLLRPRLGLKRWGIDRWRR